MYVIELITDKLIMIALFILIIHSIETLAYAVRLSGARVRLLASALSLFNVMVMVSRLSNMMQQPFTGSLIDKAPSANALQFVENQFRFLIGSASLGTLLGIICLPTFVAIFSKFKFASSSNFLLYLTKIVKKITIDNINVIPKIYIVFF